MSPDGKSIRANQGHSVDVELGLRPKSPPTSLYHGTVSKFLDSIRIQGLMPGSRQYVHLSADPGTAEIVGKRRGRPVILVIEAERMAKDAMIFYQSLNGVWLTKHVPANYILP